MEKGKLEVGTKMKPLVLEIMIRDAWIGFG